jgi:hypothetical protein
MTQQIAPYAEAVRQAEVILSDTKAALRSAEMTELHLHGTPRNGVKLAATALAAILRDEVEDARQRLEVANDNARQAWEEGAR